MKLALALAILTLHCQTTSLAQTYTPAASDESWSNAIQAAASLGQRGEFRQALQSYERLLSMPRITSNIERRAYVLSRMADTEIELGEYPQAEAQAREASTALVSTGLTHTITFAMSQDTLADALRVQGNYREAKSTAERAIATAKEIINPRQPRYAILLTTLALILQETGDLHRAEKLCREVLDIYLHATEKDLVPIGQAYQNLALVYALQGKTKPALNAINLALAAWNQALPPDHPFKVYALSIQIVVYLKMKAYRQAEENIPHVLELGLARFGRDHPVRVILLNNAASVYVSERKYAEAESLLREATQVARHRFPPGHPQLTGLLRNYSYVLAKLNRQGEASRVRAESEALLVSPLK